jgi:hypothetical protein
MFVKWLLETLGRSMFENWKRHSNKHQSTQKYYSYIYIL